MRIRGFEVISSEQWVEDLGLNWGGIRQPDMPLPKHGSKNSAGYDFHAPYTFTVPVGKSVKVPTGIKAYMQPREFLGVFSRSGIGFKYDVMLSNNVGIIDMDYYNNSKNEGHIWVKLINLGEEDLTFEAGERMCQGIFLPYLPADGEQSSEERNGGLGSTNK